MRFKSLDLTAKKWLLAFLLCLFCWWLFSAAATCSASGMQEPVYQITETELTQLENNISALKSINDRLQTDLRAQSNEATALRKEVTALRKELDRLHSQSQTQENSLMNANRSLAEYATEAKKTRLRIKAQRNTWLTVALVAATAAIIR